MIIEKYIPGDQNNAAYEALYEMMRDHNPGKSFADMIRLRLNGGAVSECNDTYYLVREDTQALARLWTGWGKHEDAIGNWGNFYTEEAHRGKGIGGALLNFWFEDFKGRADLPRCLLCSAGTKELTDLYRKFGFRTAIAGTDHGALYLPLGDSPASFRDFYDKYYKASDILYHRKAMLGYRHEIDCLLKFALTDLDMEFGIAEINSVESAILYHADRCGMLFSEDGHCVGWSMDGVRQVYPLYAHSLVVEACEIPTDTFVQE